MPTRRDQIADAIEAAIRSGNYPPGTELPSVETLTIEHEVASATARAAMDILRSRGLIETRQGIRSRVVSRLPEPGRSVEERLTALEEWRAALEKRDMESGLDI